ncbi:MAG: DUF433 domain-containing protein [Gammaproteobacteria bacterium]|nr:DUF433 domain-containing protein [Gammaproteobacteria bacterium]
MPRRFLASCLPKGTRTSVELILDRVTDGWSTDDLLNSYPNVRH